MGRITEIADYSTVSWLRMRMRKENRRCNLNVARWAVDVDCLCFGVHDDRSLLYVFCTLTINRQNMFFLNLSGFLSIINWRNVN